MSEDAAFDPGPAAARLLADQGRERAVATCDMNAAACMRGRDLEGHGQWKAIAAAVARLSQAGPEPA